MSRIPGDRTSPVAMGRSVEAHGARSNVIFNQGVGAGMIAGSGPWAARIPQTREMAVSSHEAPQQRRTAGSSRDRRCRRLHHDQGIRPGSNVEKLATLPTPFKGRVASSGAGNASQISDGLPLLCLSPQG